MTGAADLVEPEFTLACISKAFRLGVHFFRAVWQFFMAAQVGDNGLDFFLAQMSKRRHTGAGPAIADGGHEELV